MTASGRVARDAARYSNQLCRAIVKGMIDEMQWRGIWRRGEVGLHAMTDEDPIAQFPDGCTGKFRDDVTGQLLKDELVREARAKELQYFCDKGVWVKRPKHEARQKTGRGAISVRWVDVNKGDDLHPRYRSRLAVAGQGQVSLHRLRHWRHFGVSCLSPPLASEIGGRATTKSLRDARRSA